MNFQIPIGILKTITIPWIIKNSTASSIIAHYGLLLLSVLLASFIP